MTRKILSDATALREARKRWGKDARVSREKCFQFQTRKGRTLCIGFGAMGHGYGCPGGLVYFQVGKIAFGFFSVMGIGGTWAEAFARADGTWKADDREGRHPSKGGDHLREREGGDRG